MPTENLPPAICPILTAAVMARPVVQAEASRVIGIGAVVGKTDVQGEPEAIPCQGTQCMMFMAQADASGKIIGGQCAATAAVSALSNITLLLSKLTPAPEKK